MIEPAPQYSVHMLDECEISLIQRIFLRFMAIVQCNFFAVINQPRVLKPKFALQSSFLCHILSKRRCQCPHNICRKLNKQAHGKKSLSSDGP